MDWAERPGAVLRCKGASKANNPHSPGTVLVPIQILIYHNIIMSCSSENYPVDNSS